MNRIPIYVSSYPKSGSTWLTRLLGDVLNSPTGGSMPEQDNVEVATEGQDRPGDYIVRKGHFVLIDNNTGPVVPAPHRLAWRQLTNEKIVFLVRDPRDICVSGAWHWNKSTDQKAIESFMDRMFKGDVARCGRWDEYCDKHYSVWEIDDKRTIVKYENLLNDAQLYLHRCLLSIGIFYNSKRMVEAIERNSFQSRLKLIEDTEQSRRKNNMRKGIAGDWKNHFTPQMNDRMWSEFGWMMEKLGYEK